MPGSINKNETEWDVEGKWDYPAVKESKMMKHQALVTTLIVFYDPDLQLLGGA